MSLSRQFAAVALGLVVRRCHLLVLCWLVALFTPGKVTLGAEQRSSSSTRPAVPEAGSTVEQKARPQAYVLDPKLPNVLIIGDSISLGYTPPLRELLKGKANIIRPLSGKKLAVNCEGTTCGLINLEQWLGTNKWDVIHFNFGLHDMKRVKTPGDSQASSNSNDPRQADLATYEANLEKLVGRLEQTGARLIFATTTPVPADVAYVPRTPEDVPQYNAAAVRVMAKHHVAVDDLYQICLPRLKQIQKPKNVHFTDAGSRDLAQEVARAIESQLQNQH